MSWDTSTRRSRLPADWSKRREAIRKQAGGQCQHHDHYGIRCTQPGTECDHIVNNDDHALTNLQWLCHQHHAEKTAREAAAARGKRPTTTRRSERHPGLR